MEKWLYTAVCLETEICRRQFPKFYGHAVDMDRRGRVRLMKRTDTFFVIHNFNTVPEEILAYCKDYIIYDASTEQKITEELRKRGYRYVHVENTGHNITTYFRYFVDYYEELPEYMCLCKGNMLGRHCSKEYFGRVYDNKYFTYLYEDKNIAEKLRQQGIGQEGDMMERLISESHFLEENTSWYVESPNHPHRYFDEYNSLLSFVYKKPVLPKYNVFAPGACYIVNRSQVRKHSPEFYRNMNKIMSYGMNPSFPSEAHQVERMLPVIFCETYEENEWMNDEAAFGQKIEERIPLIQFQDSIRGKRMKKLRRLEYRLRKGIGF